MHVGSVLLFDGAPPAYDELRRAGRAAADLVPRYRQKLAFPRCPEPPGVDRRPALQRPLPRAPHRAARARRRGRAAPARRPRVRPAPGPLEAAVGALARGPRRATTASRSICKTHHCLVDGISGVDIATVLFDLEPDPPPPPGARAVVPRPEPTGARCSPTRCASAPPRRRARAAPRAGAVRAPAARRWAPAPRRSRAWRRSRRAGIAGAPRSPLNVRIGPHRRFAWVDADLDRFKAIKNALGGTVNDVVLTVVAGALRPLPARTATTPTRSS